MTEILQILYEIIIVVFYVFISSILLYRRMFSRWFSFSITYLIIYIIGSYVFFGTVPFLLEAFDQVKWYSWDTRRILEIAFILLVFVGTFIVIGIAGIFGADRRRLVSVIVVYASFLFVLYIVMSLTIGFEYLSYQAFKHGSLLEALLKGLN